MEIKRRGIQKIRARVDDEDDDDDDDDSEER